jgi:hypothetical protein
MKEEVVKKEEAAKEAGVPAAPQTPEPGPTPQAPAPTRTRAVIVEFKDGDLRVYQASAFKLDRDALTMATSTGPVAIPAGMVKEARLREVMVDPAGNILDPKEARP